MLFLIFLIHVCWGSCDGKNFRHHLVPSVQASGRSRTDEWPHVDCGAEHCRAEIAPKIDVSKPLSCWWWTVDFRRRYCPEFMSSSSIVKVQAKSSFKNSRIFLWFIEKTGAKLMDNQTFSERFIANYDYLFIELRDPRWDIPSPMKSYRNES